MMSFTLRTGTIIAALVAVLGTSPVLAAGGGAELSEPHDGWTFDGFFGRYDRASLLRGYQVYEGVCASCHGLQYVAYRNLADAGGLELSMDQVRAIAANHQVPAGPNEYGEEVDEYGMALTRPGIPADYIPSPFSNEIAARAANNGTLPPDLSLMAKARANGPSYIYSLLLGYGQETHDELAPGMSYNPIFPGGQIAMMQPLFEGSVEYEDGTEATLEQMSYDVTNFLMWAAEPRLEKRKRMGFQVLTFLLLLAGLCYATYRRVWRDVEH